MTTIQTSEITPETPLSARDARQIYNGLDVCVTLEVFEELSRSYNAPPEIYSFERALQAPYMEIMNRGFRVDSQARASASAVLREREELLRVRLDLMAQAVWYRGLNPRSPKQLAEFFFEALHLPEVWLSQKGVRRLSTNREALEKCDIYMHARPFVSAILAIRDIAKQRDVLEQEIDQDGRFRTSYNIAGTETGRPSSSTSSFGTGGNAQNIAPGLRSVFVADPGWKLCVIDLEQVEARDVGFFCGCLFNDWSFLDACESGDLHTNNARRIWPELPWSTNASENRRLADRIFYRDFSYRDMAKRGSHLSNYSGTAWTAARSLKVPLPMMEEFQARYIRGGRLRDGTLVSPAFPCIPRWWQWTATELQTSHTLVTPFGRRRHFFGRPGDDTTLREAIAFLPQSTTADRMNLGLWRVWKQQPKVQLLAQTYDSITFQVREGSGFDEEVAAALKAIRVELFAPNGRSYIVPGEAKISWNWGYWDEKKNPDGLKKWDPSKPDTRRRLGQLGFESIMQ